MLVELRRYTVRKHGNQLYQNDDQFHDSVKRGEGSRAVYLAVSDGASQSIFAGRWAKSLASSSNWYKFFQPERFAPDDVMDDWLSDARSILDTSRSSTAAWYVKAKAAQGSAATFLGVRIKQRALGQAVTVDAIAVGDGCVFHIVDGSVEDWFPRLAVADFDNSPEVLSSLRSAASPMPLPIPDPWRLRRGNTVILGTDAISHWIVSDHVRNTGTLARLLACRHDDDFEALVMTERQAGRLKNDDTTVVLATRVR